MSPALVYHTLKAGEIRVASVIESARAIRRLRAVEERQTWQGAQFWKSMPMYPFCVSFINVAVSAENTRVLLTKSMRSHKSTFDCVLLI